LPVGPEMIFVPTEGRRLTTRLNGVSEANE